MKLNYKRTILIGLAFLSISAFWQMYDNIIPLILTNSFELGDYLRKVNSIKNLDVNEEKELEIRYKLINK